MKNLLSKGTLWGIFGLLTMIFIYLFNILPLPFGFTLIDSISLNCEKTFQEQRATVSCQFPKGERYSYAGTNEISVDGKSYKFSDIKWNNLPSPKQFIEIDNPAYNFFPLLPSKFFREYEFCVKNIETTIKRKHASILAAPSLQIPSDYVSFIFNSNDEENVKMNFIKDKEEPSCKKITSSGGTLNFKLIIDSRSTLNHEFSGAILSPKLENGTYISNTTADLYTEPVFKMLALIVYCGVIVFLGGIITLLHELNNIWHTLCKPR